jgi:hypothetical protein
LGDRVSPDMDHQVWLQSVAGGGGGACPRSDPADLPGSGSKYHPGSDRSGSHPYAGSSATAAVAGQTGAIHQRAVVAEVARRVSAPTEAILGATSVGAGDEKTILEYIEKQKWDEDDQGFKVTAPTEP